MEMEKELRRSRDNKAKRKRRKAKLISSDTREDVASKIKNKQYIAHLKPNTARQLTGSKMRTFLKKKNKIKNRRL